MNKKVEEITKKLEEGVTDLFSSDNYRAYLKTMSKFYNYSANNALLIHLQMPGATRVAGYTSWNDKFHRHVKKGEKAIKILAPCPYKVKIQSIDPVTGESVEDEISRISFRVASVFDVSQTEGEDLPEICHILSGSVDGYSNLFQSLCSISPVPVSFEDIKGGANGYFNTAEKCIRIRQGMSELQTIKTLIHEISHAILHDRETGEEKDASHRMKEVQAESTAYVVCSYLGLDTSDYSFGYVVGWSKDKSKDLLDCLEVVQKTAKQIIEGLHIVDEAA